MTGSNHFVLGLEPSNCKIEGRHAEGDAGTLKILKPGEMEDFRLELQVLDGETEVIDAMACTRSQGVDCVK